MSYSAIDPRVTDRKSEASTRSDTAGVPSPAPAIDRLLRYLEKLSSGRFFGKVVVSFQNGKVCDVKIEQTKKLDEL